MGRKSARCCGPSCASRATAKVDAEQTLRLTVNAFVERFRAVEDNARETGQVLSQLPAERRRVPWSEPAVRALGLTERAQ
jgi:uncharacterized protein YabN with tetrapyrrole methylase and pyrophosphatase domain